MAVIGMATWWLVRDEPPIANSHPDAVAKDSAAGAESRMPIVSELIQPSNSSKPAPTTGFGFDSTASDTEKYGPGDQVTARAPTDAEAAARIQNFRTYDPAGWNEWVSRRFEEGLGDAARVTSNSASLERALADSPQWQEADNRFECSADLCRLDFAAAIQMTRLRIALQRETTSLPDAFFQKQLFGFERPGGGALRMYIIRTDIDYSDVPE